MSCDDQCYGRHGILPAGRRCGGHAPAHRVTNPPSMKSCDLLSWGLSGAPWWRWSMVGQPTVVIPCGHLVIDLSQHKLPIEFLLKRFNTNPSTRWPPDEDAGDDSDPGDEPPPWKKRPRTHTEKGKHDPTGRLLTATAGHACEEPEEPPEPYYAEMTEERREQYVRAAAFLQSGDVSNYTPSAPGHQHDEDPDLPLKKTQSTSWRKGRRCDRSSCSHRLRRGEPRGTRGL